MQSVSSIRSKIGETLYKHYNGLYPLIEGYLFQKLDEILVVASISQDMSYTIKKSLTFGVDVILEITFFKDFGAQVILATDQRRIGLIIKNRSNLFLKGPIKKEDVIKQIYEKFNLKNSDRHIWCADYDFKYNYKNCQRIIDIIKYLMTIEEPKDQSARKLIIPRIRR